MSSLKIIIIGGGLSGALLANGLILNNIQVTIYERDTADSKREGYQIRLGDSALTGLKSCLPKESLDLITSKLGQSSGATATAPAIYNSKWEEVMDLALMPTYSKTSAINRVVLRDLLMEPVKKANNVVYNKRFEKYSIVENERGHEKVQVTFTDGSNDVCDILIGADGSGSRINVQLGARNLVSLDSHFSFVSKGDLPLHRLKHMPKRLLKGPIIVFNGVASLYFALYLPSSEGRESNAVAGDPKRDSDIGYNQSSASFYWGMTIHKSLCPYSSPKEIPDARQFLLDKVQELGWAKELQDLLRTGSEDENAGVEAIQFRASETLSKDWRAKAKTTTTNHAKSDGVGSPRVWLIGDAVHAMQPNRGQGGNQALHDAADLLPELLALNDIALSLENKTSLTETQIEQACQRYESAMFDRAFSWVKKSGGTTFPSLDFDGILGAIAKLLSWTVLPIIRIIYQVFSIRA
ncbi:hypothetical protein NX059_008172 [Plenodomus lindquistii]|nr:hypothetical protein NX059_008172 [Plenodomus lindquistii]